MEDFICKTEEFNVGAIKCNYKQARRIKTQNPTQWNLIW